MQNFLVSTDSESKKNKKSYSMNVRLKEGTIWFRISLSCSKFWHILNFYHKMEFLSLSPHVSFLEGKFFSHWKLYWKMIHNFIMISPYFPKKEKKPFTTSNNKKVTKTTNILLRIPGNWQLFNLFLSFRIFAYEKVVFDLVVNSGIKNSN